MELVILIVILGLLFDYTNGFHDAANVVSTVIATKVLAPVSAIVMAGVLNFIGATQISGVAQTVATGLVDAGHATQIVVLSAVGVVFSVLLVLTATTLYMYFLAACFAALSVTAGFLNFVSANFYYKSYFYEDHLSRLKAGLAVLYPAYALVCLDVAP